MDDQERAAQFWAQDDRWQMRVPGVIRPGVPRAYLGTAGWKPNKGRKYKAGDRVRIVNAAGPRTKQTYIYVASYETRGSGRYVLVNVHGRLVFPSNIRKVEETHHA